jgi:hypothetical protein
LGFISAIAASIQSSWLMESMVKAVDVFGKKLRACQKKSLRETIKTLQQARHQQFSNWIRFLDYLAWE